MNILGLASGTIRRLGWFFLTSMLTLEPIYAGSSVSILRTTDQQVLLKIQFETSAVRAILDDDADPASEFHWQILPDSSKTLVWVHPFFTSAAVQSIDVLELTTRQVEPSGAPLRFSVHPSVFDIQRLGKVRDEEVQALYIYPVRQTTDGGFEIIQSLLLDIRFQGKTETTKTAFQKNALYLALKKSLPRQRRSGLTVLGKTSGESNRAQVKIVVDRDGIYQIRYEDLVEAGIPLPNRLESWSLRLTCRDREVPIYVEDHNDGRFDPGDYIEFYGQYSRAPQSRKAPDVYLDVYSTENVYWLEWGSARGQRLMEEEGLVLETDPRNYRRVYSFPARMHFERDLIYNRLGQYQGKEPRDHWFWASVFSSEKREIPIPLPDPDTQSDMPVELRIMLHGQTYSDSLPHTVEAFLNQRLVLNGQWFGQTVFLLKNREQDRINANVLHPTRNSVTIVNRAPDDFIDSFFINWIEITYPRLLKADQGYIEFTIPKDEPLGLFDFEISGFTQKQISIYKLGISRMIGADVDRVVEEADTTYVVRFQDEVHSPEVRYVAVQESAKLKPVRIEPHDPLELRNPSNPGDYIAIVADSLYDSEALQQLVSHREAQGHRVFVVPVSQVFNQFSYGLPWPHGIRDFLRYAYFHWPIAPKYAVLIGDGSFDQRNIRKQGTNLIPVYARQVVKYGAAVSEHWFSLMTDPDELPDIYVGRLPVNTPEELQAVVDKIIESETLAERGKWLNRMLLIGGNGAVFRRQSEFLLKNVLPPRLDVHRLYTRRDPRLKNDPFFGGTSDLIDYFDRGVFLINFMGHGGGAIWADNSLMRLEDVERLSNKGRYPIITSMTCFTGSFDNSWSKTLAEEFLLQPERGSHAIIASSGLGWAYQDFSMVRELFDLMRQYGSALTLGEYLAAAKINYISKNLNALGFSMLNQYNLLGDPATRLLLPDPKIQIEEETPFVQKGETLTVSGTTEFQQGDGIVQLVDEQRVTAVSAAMSVEGGRFETRIDIPDTLTGQKVWLRVYARNATGDQHGSAAQRLNFNFIQVDSIFSNVLTAKAGVDSVFFFARVTHANPLRMIQIATQLPTREVLPLAYDSGRQLYRTARGYPPLRNGEVVRFRLVVEDQQGNRFTSAWLDERLPFGPDLKVHPNYIQMQSDGLLTITASVFNIGDVDVQDAVIRFEGWNAAAKRWQWIADDTIRVRQKDRAIARAAVSPRTGEWRVRITADPDQRIPESDEQNNQAVRILAGNVFPVTAQNGTTLNFTRTDTIHFDAFLRFYVPAGVVSQNRMLRIDRLEKVPVFHQPDFIPVTAGDRAVAYSVSLQDSGQSDPLAGVRLIFPADSVLQIAGNGAPSSGMLQICRFDSVSQKWIRIPAENTGEAVQANVTAPGLYGLFQIHDRTPPNLELTVQGQLLSLGGYVPADPVFHLLATDLNGIDRSESSVRVWIDDAAIPYSEFTFADSAAQLNATALLFRPQLSPGEHVLRAQIRDAAGNESEPFEVLFKVADAQKLIFLGNYPNPFENATTFAFELSDHARDLELKIYTTSGHLIRTISVDDIVEDPNPLGPNYHEITWDARDEFGERVANGLYYFKLKVVFQSGVVEHVGRIARLK